MIIRKFRKRKRMVVSRLMAALLDNDGFKIHKIYSKHFKLDASIRISIFTEKKTNNIVFKF